MYLRKLSYISIAGYRLRRYITPISAEPAWQSILLGASLIRAHAIDIIHAHLPNAHLLAGILGSLTETPALATIHRDYLSMRDLEVHKLTQTHISVVARSAYFQALSLGIPASKLRFIANGVDTEIFHPVARTDYLHSIVNIPPETPLVAFIGRLSPEKGPEVFIQVARRVHDKLKSCHFILVGEGPMLQKLREDIHHLDLDSHVHMVGVQSDMRQVYASLDLVVSTSYSDAMPLAIMEAMASGLPVIATTVGGVIDIIEAGQTGLLNRVGDLNGIATDIVRLVSDESARREMGRAARKRIEEHFLLSNSVSQTSALLRSLAQAGYYSERRIGHC